MPNETSKPPQAMALVVSAPGLIEPTWRALPHQKCASNRASCRSRACIAMVNENRLATAASCKSAVTGCGTDGPRRT